MKSLFKFPLLLLIGLLILPLTGCAPFFSGNDGLVIAETYRLESGETLDQDLTVVGGDASIEENATVNGDLAVIGGNVMVDGEIRGNISVMGGSVRLGDTAVVTGDVETLGGTVHRSPGAVVEGRDDDRLPGPDSIPMMRTPAMQVSYDPITGPLMAILQAVALGALAMLVNLFAARPMERAGQTMRLQPVQSGGVGCLTLLILLIMGITIILLPISLIGLLLAGIAGLFGWLALGLVVGRQIAVWLKQPWTDPVNAGVGTLAVTLLASLLNLIWCIGWIPSTLISLIVLGAVVLTRFGTQNYPTASSGGMPPRPAPYAPVPPPTAQNAQTYETPAPDFTPPPIEPDEPAPPEEDEDRSVT